MFVVLCICTQCVFHGNKFNFNAGIYVIMTILNTNLGLSQISPQRNINSIMLYSWSIHLSHLILPSSLIYPFIPFIYHLFIFIYKICICFILFYFFCFTLLTYLYYLFLLHNLFSFTLIYLIYFTLFLFTLLISFIRWCNCEPAGSNYKIYWFLSDYLL